ncbi:MAG: 30S ribosomal protein S12 methylthiotransferase RimO [Deltaproteobacteria bacterium]|nr:30S ribosomal protein S12 methylthiotransferase RimO [Deltaproteobacteria bacterium]
MPVHSPDDADVIVVNTCAFLESAVEEAIDTILKFAQIKEKAPEKKLVVCGCLVQRYGKKLIPLLPEVDYFFGTAHYENVPSVLSNLKQVYSKILISNPGQRIENFRHRLVSTLPSHAYLKVAEGCSNGCTYCYIPKLRGPLRSRPVEDLLKEVEFLDKQGVSELIVVAQDVAAYGIDLYGGLRLVTLLECIEERVKNIRWIRLLYAYPDHINDELLLFMADSERVVPYLDVPFQHCSRRILKAMGRRGLALNPAKVVEKIKKILPHITLRTTFIVGFPGESDRDFKELERFMTEMQFDYVGVFSYSRERGTRAARLKEQIPEDVKEERRIRLYEVQRAITSKNLAKYVGKVVPVLVDGYHPDSDLLLAGRTPGQAPEVDGVVIITEGTAEAGRIVPVEILRIHDYDMEGRIVESHCKPPVL